MGFQVVVEFEFAKVSIDEIGPGSMVSEADIAQ